MIEIIIRIIEGKTSKTYDEISLYIKIGSIRYL